ncbi:MAG: hypothetical protein HC915_02305 [Anaerolineae bacterium]|nr:hypothetical protein [Anaerolineae bacterium]
MPVSEPLNGRLIDWEWNTAHSRLILTLEDGARRFWSLGTDGSVRNITPGGPSRYAEWQ